MGADAVGYTEMGRKTLDAMQTIVWSVVELADSKRGSSNGKSNFRFPSTEITVSSSWILVLLALLRAHHKWQVAQGID